MVSWCKKGNAINKYPQIQSDVGSSTPPPAPLYKLRQCTELLRSLRLLYLGQGRSLRATNTTTDTHVRARMI